MDKESETEIRTEWFKDHKAELVYFHKVTLLKAEEIIVLDWRKPDTCIFAVRYVFDGNHMYVSGDLGEAVFHFTEKADPDRIAGYNLSYFNEKLKAFADPRRDFNKETAKTYLNDWRKEHSDEAEGFGRKTWAEAWQELYNMAEDCSTVKEWEIKLADFNINRMGNDAWEWIYSIGDEVPLRLQSYLIGLKMAVEQLRVKV